MLSAFFEFWDQVELALVTLPFWLQIVVMLGVGVPLFALVAWIVEWIADRVVHLARFVVGGGAPEAAPQSSTQSPQNETAIR